MANPIFTNKSVLNLKQREGKRKKRTGKEEGGECGLLSFGTNSNPSCNPISNPSPNPLPQPIPKPTPQPCKTPSSNPSSNLIPIPVPTRLDYQAAIHQATQVPTRVLILFPIPVQTRPVG